MPTSYCRWRLLAVVLSALIALSACNLNAALEEVHEARQLSSDLQLQFTKASEDSNLAAMATSDGASKTFANDARQRTAAIAKDIDALAGVLDKLRFEEEGKLLEQFRGRFAEYQKVDSDILTLAVENTNFKAQQLSFTTAQQAVDALGESLDALAPQADSKEAWRVRALAGQVAARAREIQALQAPHIAESNDQAMTQIEQRMNAAEAAARGDLKTLTSTVPAGLRPQVAAATTQLDQLVAINRQVIDLSRRNTNVRSMALALNQKRAAVTGCEEPLHALQQALAKRGYVGTR